MAALPPVPDQSPEQAPDPAVLPGPGESSLRKMRRAAAVGAAVLALVAGGASVAYATSAGDEPVATEYGTVVEVEGDQPAADQAATGEDCPDQAPGGGSGSTETPQTSPTPDASTL